MITRIYTYFRNQKNRMPLSQNENGFSLVELLVVMIITVFVLAATTQILTRIITTFKQQSSIAETGVESLVGFEVLRRDIQSAGFGLGSGIANGISTYDFYDWTRIFNEGHYSEVTNPDASDPNDTIKPADFNDNSASTAYASSTTAAPPRPFISTNPSWTINGSDYLAIKGANLGSTSASGKFHTLKYGGEINTWLPEVPSNPTLDSNLRDTDYVLVISIRDTSSIGLVEDSTTPGKYYSKKNDLLNFEPPDNREVRLIYGLDSTSVPKAPFNRADYYISSQNNPLYCAPNTGSLVKSSMLHSSGKLGQEMPLIDCVADFQVVYGLDTASDGNISYVNSLISPMLSAQEIKTQLKEVRVFILLQEGRSDARNPFHPDITNLSDTTIWVGNYPFGRDFDLAANIGSTWMNYKWRVIQLVESPTAMR